MFSEQETALAVVLEQIYVETERQFVFLIDEWDCVMHERQEVYDSEKKEAFIPNKEIVEEFENAMSVGGWQEIACSERIA